MGKFLDRMTEHMLREVSLREVGPREGFQRNRVIPTEDKVRIINLIQDAGIKKIQAVSFVNPKFVPHWADAEEVMQRIEYRDDVVYEGLVLNERGLDRAIATTANGKGVKEVIFLSGLTDSILRKNGLPYTVAQFMGEVLPPMVAKAGRAGLRTVISVSGAVGCAMEGYVPQDTVIDFVKQVRDMGTDEAHIGDSTGEGSPRQIVGLFERLAIEFPDYPLAVHFHNNRGTCIANLFAILECGFPNLTIDTAIGEVGGSPFAGGAGNLSTEDVVVMLHSLGIRTGVDAEKILAAAKALQELYDFPLVSHTVHHGLPKWWYNQPGGVEALMRRFG